MEYWNLAKSEDRLPMIPAFQYSIIPLLLTSQRHHGIDPRRPAGGEITGQQRHSDQQQRDCPVSRRVPDADAVKEVIALLAQLRKQRTQEPCGDSADTDAER